MKKNVLVLGGRGMLGRMAVSYINSLEEYAAHSCVRDKNTKENEIHFDAHNNLKEFEKIIEKMKPELVINCIGIVKPLVKEDNMDAVAFINSYLPHKLAKICRQNDIKLIHISTDCVFSGEHGNYDEESPYSPVDFYGLSKAAGEFNDTHNLTIRTSIIGPEEAGKGRGLMDWFFNQKGKSVNGFTKSIWSGLTTLELSKKIIEMYEKKVSGLINIASQPINKYDLLCLIKKIYNLGIGINSVEGEICDRSMKSIRKDAAYEIPSHEQMLKELKEWKL